MFFLFVLRRYVFPCIGDHRWYSIITPLCSMTLIVFPNFFFKSIDRNYDCKVLCLHIVVCTLYIRSIWASYALKNTELNCKFMLFIHVVGLLNRIK